jgi:hypothetical protein
MTLDDLDQRVTIPVLKTNNGIVITRHCRESDFFVNVLDRTTGHGCGFGGPNREVFPADYFEQQVAHIRECIETAQRNV